MGLYMGYGIMGRVWADCMVPRGGGRSCKQLGTEGPLPTLREVKLSVHMGDISLKSIKEPQDSK